LKSRRRIETFGAKHKIEVERMRSQQVIKEQRTLLKRVVEKMVIRMQREAQHAVILRHIRKPDKCKGITYHKKQTKETMGRR
jgi:hypothetical protein